jgi:hypothetical protein
MRRYDVNFEEKEEVQGPKTDEESNAHVTTAAGSEERATTVTLADECAASYLTNRYKKTMGDGGGTHTTRAWPTRQEWS